MSAKDDFIAEACKIKREGVQNLLGYLQTSTDFYTSPASVKFHGAEESGLLLHSLSVLDVMKELNTMLQVEIEEDSILICGLFHDLCKANFYAEDAEEATSAQMRKFQELTNESLPKGAKRTKAYLIKVIDALVKKEPIPPYTPSYKVKDQLPMGHGEKSIYLIQKYMDLLDAEALAIRWHLGGFDPGIHFGYPSGLPCTQAFRENKLVSLLAVSDLAASYLVDAWPEVN